MKTIFCSLIICIALAFTIPSYSCTTFCISTQDELVFGRNYDFMVGYGIVFVNKKGVSKEALTSQKNPAKWISKYGSVTFNQYGREFPTGGINETGLVVELMWLDETKFPAADARPATGGILQWIQYQLDNCETVMEVIETDDLIRIPERSIPVHYLITDKYGATATIEFLNGKLVAHHGDKLKHRVLTNDSYYKSIEYTLSEQGKNAIEDLNFERSSLNGFAKTCKLVESYSKMPGRTAVDFGFQVLGEISQGDATKWSIVYDIKNMVVYFKTYDASDIKNINVASLDFECTSPVKMIDINSPLTGNINDKLIPYEYEANRKLIEDSYNGVEFLRDQTKEDIDRAASYPSDLKCLNKSGMEDMKGNIPKEENDSFGTQFYLLTGLVLSSCLFIGYKALKKNRS